MSYDLNDDDMRGDPLVQRLAHLDVGPVPNRLPAVVPTSTQSTHRRGIRGRVIASLAAAVVVVAVATPVMAVVERSVLPAGLQQFLGLVTGTPHPSSARPAQNLTVDGAGTSSEVTPHASMSEAAAQVHFAIPTPRLLPPGVTFRGALVESQQAVYLHYGSDAGGGLNLLVRSGSAVGGSYVPLGAVQAGTVGGTTAYFVHGAYENSPGPGDPGTWNPNADDEELTWQHGGFTFNLTAGGLGLSMADMVRIAESVR